VPGAARAVAPPLSCRAARAAAGAARVRCAPPSNGRPPSARTRHPGEPVAGGAGAGRRRLARPALSRAGRAAGRVSRAPLSTRSGRVRAYPPTGWTGGGRCRGAAVPLSCRCAGRSRAGRRGARAARHGRRWRCPRPARPQRNRRPARRPWRALRGAPGAHLATVGVGPRVPANRV